MEKNGSSIQRDSSNYRPEDDFIVIPDSDEDVGDNSSEIGKQTITKRNNNEISTIPRIADILKNTMSRGDNFNDSSNDDAIIRLAKNINNGKYEISSDDSDHEQTNNYEDNIKEYIINFNNSDSDSSVSYSPIETKKRYIKKSKDTYNNTKDIKKFKPNPFNESFVNIGNSYKLSNADYIINKAFHDETVELNSDSTLDSNSEQSNFEFTTFADRLQATENMDSFDFEFDSDDSYWDINNMSVISPDFKKLGKKATRDKKLALTVERLQDLHGSLVARPSENEKAENPKGLNVQLMPHQQYALVWLLWREQQKPSGGVLADDMGLGKTLTMIALIISTFAKEESDGDGNNDNDEWINKNEPLYRKGGTLVVCPASLLSQWENEVRSKCKRGLLSVEVHHGCNRQKDPKKLAKSNMVITTYNILSCEHRTNSTLYKINWKRVILDEAHIVRNHKTQASKAVCALIATSRWALSGTPIQNKELDIYSILKFLKCSPFDDLRVWKQWVHNKDETGHQRLATVMKTLMLRRTKQELMAKDDEENLPEKSVEEVIVKLDRQERLVYEKILTYSRTLFAQFLTQRAEKAHMFDLYGGRYNKPAGLSNPNKETQFTKAQNKLLALHADVKTYEILVLLLRLRQICCHPALIHAMLDQEDMKQSGIMDFENVDNDLLSGVNNMLLDRIDNAVKKDIDIDLRAVKNLLTAEKENISIDEKVVGNLLTADNPVFDNDRISSKMKVLLDMVQKILQKGNDKIIIVSQWTMLLDVIALHLSSIKNATFSKFTGSVAIKDRQGIMDSFNNRDTDPRILLLSLKAGGVGLNLVGGNHLLLFDIHWNPQLETQAQDRIYRFGQTKNVYIYKFICVNTIEEHIKALQERKLQIAQNVLSGDMSNATRLTLNDLKSLFGF